MTVCFKVHSELGITLSFEVEEGTLTVYSSFEIQNPNSALNYISATIEGRIDVYVRPPTDGRLFQR